MVVSRASSERMCLLSFLGALGVAIVHASLPLEAATRLGYYAILLRIMLTRAAVPYFFIVSGYFLAVHYGEPDWWRTAIQKRVNSLLIPYLIWEFICALVMWKVPSFGLNFWGLPRHGALWYVRCLMLLVLAAPLLFRALTHWRRASILALLVAEILLSFGAATGWLDESNFLGGLFFYGFSIDGIFYFSIGALLRLGHARVPSRRLSCMALALFLAIILTIFCFPEALWRWWSLMRIVQIPLLLLALFGLAPTKRILPGWLLRSAFPLFLLHVIIYDPLRRFAGLSGWWLWLVGCALSIAFAQLLYRFFPRVARVAFGGR